MFQNVKTQNGAASEMHLDSEIVRMDGTVNPMGIVGGGNQIALGANNGTENCTAKGAVLAGTFNIQDGNKHFVVCTWDGTDVKLYVDGVFDTQMASSGAFGALAATIGLGGPLPVHEDEVFLMKNRALTAQEISDLYANGEGREICVTAGCGTPPVKNINVAVILAEPFDTPHNSGRHTGPLPNGDIELGIPGSTYQTIGDNDFVLLPASDTGSLSAGTWQLKAVSDDTRHVWCGSFSISRAILRKMLI